MIEMDIVVSKGIDTIKQSNYTRKKCQNTTQIEGKGPNFLSISITSETSSSFDSSMPRLPHKRHAYERIP